jgi:hypothetical protein
VELRLVAYINSRAETPDDNSCWENVQITNGTEGEELALLLNSHVYLVPDLNCELKGDHVIEAQQKFFGLLDSSNADLMSLDMSNSDLRSGGR